MSTSEQDTRALRPIMIFFILAVATAGCMFTYKLFAFLSTIRRDELAGFAFDPIIVYGFVALGFFFLLAWAFLSGQFRQVEQVKIDMVENFFAEEEREYEEQRRNSK
jgi:hypothetical protein